MISFDDGGASFWNGDCDNGDDGGDGEGDHGGCDGNGETGGGDQGQESVSAADSQDALVKRYVAAISGLLDAQYNFALAFDLKDEAAKIQDAKNLINNDTSKNGLKTATNVSSETDKLIMSKTGEQTIEKFNFYLNDQDMGTAFENQVINGQLYPALTLDSGM